MHDSIYGHFLNDKILETKDSLVVGQRWRRNYQEEDGCDKKGHRKDPCGNETVKHLNCGTEYTNPQVTKMQRT